MDGTTHPHFRVEDGIESTEIHWAWVDVGEDETRKERSMYPD